MNLEGYINLFKENKWEKYLPNLYKYIIDGRDVNELIECIEKLESSNKDTNSKPAPILKITDAKDVKVVYNKETNTYTVKSPEPAKVGVGCPSGEQGYLEDDHAGCRVLERPITNLLKKRRI